MQDSFVMIYLLCSKVMFWVLSWLPWVIILFFSQNTPFLLLSSAHPEEPICFQLPHHSSSFLWSLSKLHLSYLFEKNLLIFDLANHLLQSLVLRLHPLELLPKFLELPNDFGIHLGRTIWEFCLKLVPELAECWILESPELFCNDISFFFKFGD